jgi:hypothetical protein
MHRYWPSACPRCPNKSPCTPSDYRRIARWEHEQVLDDMQHRLERTPQASRLRRQTVEHPFGTLKAWMGSAHFLTKTLPQVRTEMSLLVMAYNLKRALNIFGTQLLVAFMWAQPKTPRLHRSALATFAPPYPPRPSRTDRRGQGLHTPSVDSAHRRPTKM